MDASTPAAGWDEEYDVIVVGSGAGGMTAALYAQSLGLTALVIEKSDKYGGASAVSGGGIWVPLNDQIEGLGGHDSFEDAMSYLEHLIGGEVPRRRVEAYVRNAHEMVSDLAQRFGVHFNAVARYPDYFPDAPGGKPGYRTMEPADFDAAKLGSTFDEQREPYPTTQMMGRISMSQVEAHVLFTRAPGWIGLTLRMMAAYWFDLRWRLRRGRRDRRQTLGQALVASLRHALLVSRVPLWLRTAFDGLEREQEDGRVGGVSVTRGGQRLRLRARRGVILACGGFEANQAMREQYLPAPSRAEWTAAPPINHGEGIRAGQSLGADTAFMNLTWGAPTLAVPGSAWSAALFVERGMPGCVLVNQRGERFVNEAVPYTEMIYAIHRDQEKTGASVPSWLVFDADFRRKYPMGPMLPGSIQPDRKLPKDWLGRVYWRADSVDELATQIGVDAAGLQRTLAQMKGYAETGIDTEFAKGGNIFDRYYSDASVKPNPCLAPIAKPPFYAVRIQPGEIGTKGGLLTDERARVLRKDGSAIDGLYAIGNCSAAVMGRTYPGPGATLGPAMTFGYIAAHDLARVAATGARVADAA